MADSKLVKELRARAAAVSGVEGLLAQIGVELIAASTASAAKLERVAKAVEQSTKDYRAYMADRAASEKAEG